MTTLPEPTQGNSNLRELIQDTELRLSQRLENISADDAERDLTNRALTCIQALKALCTQERQERIQDRHALIQEQQAHIQTQQELAQEQQELALERQATQQRKLLIKSKFKAAEKLILEEVQRQIDRPVVVDSEGYSRFCFSTAAYNVGMSPKAPRRTFDKILQQCPDLPLETKTVDEYDEEHMRTIPRLYIRSTQNLIQAATRAEIINQVKQGGNQYQCNRCLSHNVIILRQLQCRDCGHTIPLDPSHPNHPNKKNNTSKSGRTNLVLANSEEMDEEEDTDESREDSANGDEITVPTQDNLSDSLNQLPPLPVSQIVQRITPEEKDAAIDLYLDLAGTDPEHLEMVPAAQKYTTVHTATSTDDIRAHLNGDKTIGTRLYHVDQTTRAYVVDADNEQDLERLWEGARKLGMAGYLPIIDCPPEGRPSSEGYHEVSAHAWIVKEERENKAAGWAEILRIAPEWAELKERWPALAERAAGNRVRLPGGRYVMPGFTGWTTLYSVVTDEAATNGITQARLLLANQTPALVLPPPTPSDPTPEPPAVPPKLHHQIDPAATIVDHVHQEKYVTHGFVVAFPPGYLVEQFNAAHSVTEYVRPGAHKKYFSPNGDERTASAAAYVKDGKELLTDLSGHGLRSDGTHETYDALELHCKKNEISKDEMLRQLGREKHAQAKREIEQVARSGHPLPAWIQKLVTIVGYRHYAQVAEQAGHGEQAAEARSIAARMEAEAGHGELAVKVRMTPASNERCATCQISIDQAEDFYFIDAHISYCSQHGPQARQSAVPLVNQNQTLTEPSEEIREVSVHQKVIEVFGMPIVVPEGLRPIRPQAPCSFCKKHAWRWNADQDRWICARCKR